MNIVDIPLSEIEEAPFNYNLHPQNQIDELRGSLQEFGQFKNVVLWKGYCIAGNGLTFAARSMDLDQKSLYIGGFWGGNKIVQYPFVDRARQIGQTLFNKTIHADTLPTH